MKLNINHMNLKKHDMRRAQMSEYKELFLRKIDKYNATNDYCTHYVKLNDNQIMVIEWQHGRRWEYHIKNMEPK